MASGFAMVVEVNAREDEGADEEEKFQSTHPSSSAHHALIGMEIRIPLHKTALEEDLVKEVNRVESRGLHGHQDERGEPKDDGEDVEAEDCPVVVDDWEEEF